LAKILASPGYEEAKEYRECWDWSKVKSGMLVFQVMHELKEWNRLKKLYKIVAS
jgi:hypothetical protein